MHTMGCLPGLNRRRICTYLRQFNTSICPSSFWTHFLNTQCMLGIFVSQESTTLHRKLESLNFKQDGKCMRTQNRPCFIVSSTYLIHTHLHHWTYFFMNNEKLWHWCKEECDVWSCLTFWLSIGKEISISFSQTKKMY